MKMWISSFSLSFQSQFEAEEKKRISKIKEKTKHSKKCHIFVWEKNERKKTMPPTYFSIKRNKTEKSEIVLFSSSNILTSSSLSKNAFVFCSISTTLTTLTSQPPTLRIYSSPAFLWEESSCAQCRMSDTFCRQTFCRQTFCWQDILQIDVERCLDNYLV